MNHSLLSLLQVSDPALPIGGYSHSGGLETYVQAGVVKDAETAEVFVREMLSKNIFYTDAALVALAHGAAVRDDSAELLRLDALCEAVKLPREIREASRKLGVRLLKIFGGGGAWHYSVSFGYCCAVMGIGLREALTGYYYNAAAGMVTNCVKLIPIGQGDGQAILLRLRGLMGELIEKSLAPSEEMIGVCQAGLDIRCMQHESLYSRLYMS